MSTATPTAPPAAPGRVSREDAEKFLAGVTPWIFKLAGRYCGRLRMPLEDLAAEIMADVFERLGDYDPARGRPTTWVIWRARAVVHHIRSRRRLRRKVHATPFSVLAEVMGDRSEGEAAEVLAVAAHQPDAEAGRIERMEREEEIRDAVRDAVAGLPSAQRRAVEMIHGIGREPVGTFRKAAAINRTNYQAVHQSHRLGMAKLRAVEELQELAGEHGLG
jgi:RNA polymerase sigma factor (sigma-70 family)